MWFWVWIALWWMVYLCGFLLHTNCILFYVFFSGITEILLEFLTFEQYKRKKDTVLPCFSGDFNNQLSVYYVYANSDTRKDLSASRTTDIISLWEQWVNYRENRYIVDRWLKGTALVCRSACTTNYGRALNYTTS